MAQYAYNYNPTGSKPYLSNPITQDEFHSWTKENMYRTSYATMYTDVIIIILSIITSFNRNPMNQKIISSLDMLDSSQDLNQELNLDEPLLKSPKRV